MNKVRDVGATLCSCVLSQEQAGYLEAIFQRFFTIKSMLLPWPVLGQALAFP
jgi:hypothetical protein